MVDFTKKCPKCHGNYVGKIGYSHFFCSNCCLEYSVESNGKPIYYYSDPTGTVMKYSAPKLWSGKEGVL